MHAWHASGEGESWGWPKLQVFIKMTSGMAQSEVLMVTKRILVLRRSPSVEKLSPKPWTAPQSAPVSHSCGEIRPQIVASGPRGLVLQYVLQVVSAGNRFPVPRWRLILLPWHGVAWGRLTEPPSRGEK